MRQTTIVIDVPDDAISHDLDGANPRQIQCRKCGARSVCFDPECTLIGQLAEDAQFQEELRAVELAEENKGKPVPVEPVKDAAPVKDAVAVTVPAPRFMVLIESADPLQSSFDFVVSDDLGDAVYNWKTAKQGGAKRVAVFREVFE